MARRPAGPISALTGCSRALADTPHPEELLHPGLPQLFELQSKESLVATLEAYLDNGCDTKLTAEALFLHRASLYYRLQRIERSRGPASRAAPTGSRCTPRSSSPVCSGSIQHENASTLNPAPIFSPSGRFDVGLRSHVAVSTFERGAASRPPVALGGLEGNPYP